MPDVITFEHPLLIFGKTQAVYGGVWEAELDPGPRNAQDNAELTLYMRVHIYDGFNDTAITTKAADGKSGQAKDTDNHAYTVYPWPVDRFRLWRNNLIETARKFWHGKFWLVTPASYSKLDWPQGKPTHRPNVWCRFELTQADKADAHFSIASVYLGKSPTRNSDFRANLFLYDSDDSLNTKKHEVGHLLGLAHPGGRSNNNAAYNDRPGYPSDVMGAGKRIYCHHALPWQKAIAMITETTASDWKVSLIKVPPKPLKK